MPKFLPFRLPLRDAGSDEQAMRRIQSQGDETAFALLVQRWELPLRRLCTRMTGDEHLGEDLAQETFTRVFIHRASYDARAKFSTWLWRIALNLCHDELRRRKRRHQIAQIHSDGVDTLLEEVADETGLTPDAATEQLELAHLVRHALQRLSETHRAVLVLRHYEGLKFREIAEVLTVPEGTVKSRMVEALDRLHRLIGKGPDAPVAPSPSPKLQPSVVL